MLYHVMKNIRKAGVTVESTMEAKSVFFFDPESF